MQAAVLGMRQAQREVKNNINREARKRMKPEWTAALNRNAASRKERAVLVRGGRVTSSDRGIRLIGATSTRPLRGGLVPASQWAGFEFGMTPKVRTFQQRSPRGLTYTRSMVVGRQFGRRLRNGRVVFESASQVGTKLAGIWVRTIVDGFNIFADIKAGR